MKNVQRQSEFDVLHEPAERAGGIVPGLVAENGQNAVHVGLCDIGHVGEGCYYIVRRHDGNSGAVLVDGDISLEEAAEDDGVCVDGVLFIFLDALGSFAQGIEAVLHAHCCSVLVSVVVMLFLSIYSVRASRRVIRSSACSS